MEAELPDVWRNRADYVGALVGLRGLCHVGTDVLPRWSGWFAYGAAIRERSAARPFWGELITRPSGLPGDVTFIAQRATVICFSFASISMLRKVPIYCPTGAQRG